MRWNWQRDTTPFEDDHGGLPAKFVIRQVDDAWFTLHEPFLYQNKDGTRLKVDAATMGKTDLASVPWFMGWFVSRYGRHTPAALVHDQLTPERRDSGYIEARRNADRVILQAMDATEVPPVRSRVIWTAVVLATRWADRPWGLVSVLAWAATAIAGTVWLVAMAVALSPWLLAALLGPFVGALLWGRRDYWAGVVAGYAIWAVALPALASILVHYIIYWPLERLIQLGRSLLPHNKREDLPGPVSYKEA